MPRYRLPPPSDSGWTSVPPKSRRQTTPRRLAPTASPDDTSPAPCVPTLLRTIAETRARIASIPALHLPPPPPRTKSLEIHGLGSLHGINAASATWQLALALEIAAKAGIRDLKACDPVFTEWDREVLGELGCVVNPPTAMEGDAEGGKGGGDCAGDEAALRALFAPHLEYDVLAKVLKRGWSWVCCNDLREFVEMRVGREEERGVFEGCLGGVWGEKVLEEVEEAADGRAFNHLGVYWRRTGDIEYEEEDKEKMDKEAEKGKDRKRVAEETGGKDDKKAGLAEVMAELKI